MEFIFNLCFTTTTVTYNDIPGDMRMEDFYHTTKSKLRRDMKIATDSDFYIIQGRGSECVDDDPPMLFDDNETVEEYFATNDTTLYIQGTYGSWKRFPSAPEAQPEPLP